ncbi:MAG TPA: MMPL family transporter [Thermoleophilaceae bacterium]|nr:MMPL family transporter [Thermoleophilaceae bacterium]
MSRIAELCVRRPKTTIAVWLGLVVLLAASAPQAQRRITQSTLDIPGTPSSTAMHLYRQQFGDGVSVPILLQGPPSQVDRQGPALVRALRLTPKVRVLSPWDRATGASTLRPAPRSALVLGVLDRSQSDAIKNGVPGIQRVVAKQISPPVSSHVTGMAVIGHAIKNASFSAGEHAERIALPILALVLLLVFRSPIAAAVPAVLGFATVAAGTGALSLLATQMPIDTVAVNLAGMMGLALGVDYSLLIVSRFREEMQRAPGGDARRAAARSAAATAGRTVLFAGVALLVGMSVALLLAPGSLLLSAALGVIVVTALAIAGALTAVPATLALLGPAVDRFAIGRRSRRQGARRGLLAVPAAALRRPAFTTLLVVAAMLVLAVPALAVKAGPPNVHQLPASNPARKDFTAVQRAMGPGWVAPFEIVSVSPDATVASGDRLAELSRMQARIARDPDVATVIGPGNVADKTTKQVNSARHLWDTAGGKIRRGKRQTARLANGLAQASGGVQQLRSGLAKAAAGSARLAQGSSGAQQGAVQIAQGLAAASGGATRLEQGLGSAQAGANQLAAESGTAAQGAHQLSSTLQQISARLQQTAPQANNLAQQLQQGQQGLAAVRQPADAAHQQLQAAASALGSMSQGKSDPAYGQALSAVNAALSDTASIDQNIAAAQSATAQAAAVAAQLSNQTGSVLGQVTSGAEQLSSSLDRIHQGAESLSNGLGSLAAGGSQLQGGLQRLSGNANSLAAGISQLGSGAQSLQAGLAGGYQRSGALAQSLALMHSGVVRFRTKQLNPAARRYYQAHAQSPDLFDSGYFVLAAIQGAPATQRRDAHFAVNLSRGGSAARVFVVPRSGAITKASEQLDHRLKADSGALGRQSHTDAQLGGTGAQLLDYAHVTSQRLLLLVLALAVVTYLVLVPVFRSLVLPAIAVLLNLISVAVAFGVLSLLFQGSAPLGGPGYLDAVSVTAMYSVMFGLSIDYQVFLITRMREGYLQGGDTRRAIAYGLERTAKLVTGAAAIMLAVFAAFATTDVITIRQFGIGLAVAVAVDATVIRLVLLPAVIRLAGRHSWWLPRWLDRLLPHVDVEGHPSAARAA